MIATRVPAAARFQIDAAARLGLSARIVDPEYGYLFEIGDGERWMPMVGGQSALNNAMSARLASDKIYTAMLLERRGIRVPAWARCVDRSYFGSDLGGAAFGPRPAQELAERNGFPLIVKPNRRSHGRGVVEVCDEPGLLAAIETVWRRFDYAAIAQQRVDEPDLRLDFLDDGFLIGYERRPVRVVGDGRSTVRRLLAAALPGSPLPDGLDGDEEWLAAAGAAGVGPRSVLAAGESLTIGGTVLNLNRWATARPIFELPRRWLAHGLAVGAALGLRHFGIDFRGAALEDDPRGAAVLEVNASPLLLRIAELGWRDEALAAQAKVLAQAWKALR